jgi:hypothetical protein
VLVLEHDPGVGAAASIGDLAEGTDLRIGHDAAIALRAVAMKVSTA